jgi:hypothetical protein
MKRAAVVLLLMFAVSAWSPYGWTATAQPKTEKVGDGVEAWYYVFPDSPAPAPTPLPVAPDPVNPYGENTLHVGITGGQEDARTYIALDTTHLPTSFKLLDGTLTLPIDPDDGTVTPESARIQVCLATTPPVKSEEGSFDELPEVDCKTHSAADYEDKPYPHFEVNLTPFAEDLSFGGLAILPTDAAKEKQDSWHVAFYAKKNKDKAAKPITAKLQFVPEDLSLPSPQTTIPTTGGGGGLSTGNFDIGGGGTGFGNVGVPSGGGGTTDTGQPEKPAPAPTQVQALPQVQPTNLIQPYSIVWALPLLLLAFAFYFGGALTRRVIR